jgi:hypothetical protein
MLSKVLSTLYMDMLVTCWINSYLLFARCIPCSFYHCIIPQDISHDIAFLFAVVGVVVVEVVGTAGYYYPSIQNNRVVLVCLHLMVSFYPFSR